jgi:Na+/proline symporter
MYQSAMARPARPTVVTLAVLIMGLMALLSLLSAVISVVSIGEAMDEFRRLARIEGLDPDQINSVVEALWAGFVCTALAMVLLALLLAGLAWGVWRGSQPARVATWVVCGLGVLCACCTGLGSFASFSAVGAEVTDPEQVAGNLMVRALPGWAAGILLGSSGVNVLGYIATAILLALPVANAYFKGVSPRPLRPEEP